MVTWIKVIRQTEIHRGEADMSAAIVFEVQMACENLKRDKSPCIHPTPSELFQAGSRRVRSEIHLFLNSISNENEFPDSGRSQLFCLFVRMFLKQIVVTARAYRCYQLHTTVVQRSSVKFSTICWRNYYLLSVWMPILLVARSKAWVCCHSLVGNEDSNPTWAWMSVYCECCVLLSSQGKCVELIPRPEDSYRVWCVWVWWWGLDNAETLVH